MLWEEVEGSIRSIHCQKSMLIPPQITCCGLVRTQLLSPTMQQSTSKGRREDGQVEFNSNEQRLIGEGDDKGCRRESAAPADER
jgi:hypothetical protein